MTMRDAKIKDLHTVRYRLKDGTEKIARYHRVTRRKIYSEPGDPSFYAELRRAGANERGWKKVVGRTETKIKTGFVYFVEAVGLGAVKIGWAKDVTRRLRSMQSGCPVDLRLLGCFSAVPVDEAMLHAKFAHLRMRREWFTLSDEISDYVAKLPS